MIRKISEIMVIILLIIFTGGCTAEEQNDRLDSDVITESNDMRVSDDSISDADSESRSAPKNSALKFTEYPNMDRVEKAVGFSTYIPENFEMFGARETKIEANSDAVKVEYTGGMELIKYTKALKNVYDQTQKNAKPEHTENYAWDEKDSDSICPIRMYHIEDKMDIFWKWGDFYYYLKDVPDTFSYDEIVRSISDIFLKDTYKISGRVIKKDKRTVTLVSSGQPALFHYTVPSKELSNQVFKKLTFGKKLTVQYNCKPTDSNRITGIVASWIERN